MITTEKRVKEIRKRIDGWKMVEECDTGLENSIRVTAETGKCHD